MGLPLMKRSIKMEIELNPCTKKLRNFAVGVVSKSSLTTAERYFVLFNRIRFYIENFVKTSPLFDVLTWM